MHEWNQGLPKPARQAGGHCVVGPFIARQVTVKQASLLQQLVFCQSAVSCSTLHLMITAGKNV